MLTPSAATKAIRKIVDGLSENDLRTKGPTDLREAVEKSRLVYKDVRNLVNNELARARRKRGIRKGRGRRVAAEYPTDPEHLRLLKLFTDLDAFGKRFESWDDARDAIQQVFSFVDGFGGRKQLLEVVGVKRQNERDDETAGRL